MALQDGEQKLHKRKNSLVAPAPVIPLNSHGKALLERKSFKWHVKKRNPAKNA
jgi:hypothetical protein